MHGIKPFNKKAWILIYHYMIRFITWTVWQFVRLCPDGSKSMLGFDNLSLNESLSQNRICVGHSHIHIMLIIGGVLTLGGLCLEPLATFESGKSRLIVLCEQWSQKALFYFHQSNNSYDALASLPLCPSQYMLQVFDKYWTWLWKISPISALY